jgi:hypothetical protein
MGTANSALGELPHPIPYSSVPGRFLPPAKWTLYEEEDPPDLCVDDFSVLSGDQARMV